MNFKELKIEFSHVRLTDSVIGQLKRDGFKELNRIFELSIHVYMIE